MTPSEMHFGFMDRSRPQYLVTMSQFSVGRKIKPLALHTTCSEVISFFFVLKQMVCHSSRIIAIPNVKRIVDGSPDTTPSF